MSQEVAGDFLAWDIADRMRKALRVRNIGVQDMAEYLGVSRNTVSTWINGRITPSQQTMRLWAIRTGVPYEWLRDGEQQNSPGPDGGAEAVGGGVRREGIEPPTRWLSRPPGQRLIEVGTLVPSTAVLQHAA